MKSDINGCSTCQPGKESYEEFTFRGTTRFQYDYRTPSGELFATVAPTLDECRAKRDRWLATKPVNER